MRAARFSEYGDPSVLRVEEAPEPHAPAGAVRIRVRAAGVNPLDLMVRRGDLRDAMPLELPAIPGRDAAGVVDEVGDGVHDVQVGDEVFGLGGNTHTYAAHAVLTHWAPVPPDWSAVEAGAAGLAVTTALHALDAIDPPDGATVVVGGATGSVGAAAVALAVDRGLRVIGTARPENHGVLSSAGAVPVEYGPGLADRVRALAPDVTLYAVDTYGSTALDELVALVGEPTRAVSVCDPAGAERHGAHMAWGENDAHALAVAADLGARGGWTPRVGRVLPLEQASEAHRLAESGFSGGKIVLTLDWPARPTRHGTSTESTDRDGSTPSDTAR